MKRPSLGICAIVQNEYPYLHEWIAFHSLIGIDEFLIFDNNSTDSTKALLEGLSTKFNIIIKDWPDQRPYWKAVQRGAFLEGKKYFANKIDFVAFIDIDEFLVPLQSINLKDQLEMLPSDVSAIAVNQRVFGSSGHRHYDTELVVKRFTKRAPKFCKDNYWFKTIARPDLILDFNSSHNVLLGDGSYVLSDGSPLICAIENPGIAASIPLNETITLHHYIVKSYGEYLLKQLKWSKTLIADRYSDKKFQEFEAYSNLENDSTLEKFYYRLEEILLETSI